MIDDPLNRSVVNSGVTADGLGGMGPLADNELLKRTG